MCDEIKIKSGVAWNTATHEAVGLVGVEGKVELQDDLRAILRGDEPPGGDSDASSAGDALVAGGTSKPATYVNQWNFRSVYGRTFLLNFFFNGGSLSGDELLRQLSRTKSTAGSSLPAPRSWGCAWMLERGQQSPLLPLERRAKGRRRRLGFGGAGDVCEPCLPKPKRRSVFLCDPRPPQVTAKRLQQQLSHPWC